MIVNAYWARHFGKVRIKKLQIDGKFCSKCHSYDEKYRRFHIRWQFHPITIKVYYYYDHHHHHL
ncbi:hypothetical protein E2C01_058391 [Portunus trituberculatus]|uniref:Uncharacterized protein n=1 Tax=Portunus trituberculatus TaxID=210409 RepID=A0A5B7H2V5_PORTR|nr:hypothetical protein [Portunus trituberculatus]